MTMRYAPGSARETSRRVTFGAGLVDRDAGVRGKEADLEALAADPTTCSLITWRGNILVEPSGALARLPMDHPVVSDAASGPIYLGREAGRAVFVHDISVWTPSSGLSVPGVRASMGELPRHPALAGGEGFADLRALMATLSAADAELAATARALLSWHSTHLFCSRCGQPSAVAEAGWRRHCHHCGADHFPRTDPVVIMLITRGNEVLLGRSPGWVDGMYSLLAGFVEPGETIEAAVRREVAEETSVPVGDVEYLACQPWPFPNSLMFGCRGRALAPEIRIDPAEIEEALWLSRENLAEVFAGVHSSINPPRKGAIAEFLLRNWLADKLD